MAVFSATWILFRIIFPFLKVPWKFSYIHSITLKTILYPASFLSIQFLERSVRFPKLCYDPLDYWIKHFSFQFKKKKNNKSFIRKEIAEVLIIKSKVYYYYYYVGLYYVGNVESLKESQVGEIFFLAEFKKK